MKPVFRIFGESFIYYDRLSHKALTFEKFVPEHYLSYQVSGQTQVFYQREEVTLEEGHYQLCHRNQFSKSLKIPGNGKAYQSISVLLAKERLQEFAQEKHIVCQDMYSGTKNIVFGPNDKLKAYFQSLLPFLQPGESISKKLAATKIKEIIALLLEMQPELRAFLFDFSEPLKQDLKQFMLKNFHHNAPIKQFARLSGRSLSGFKRDFAEIFKTSPGNWLKDKRLSEAYDLIGKKGQKPQDIYKDLGFENLSHFYTAFKKKYGHTPAEIKHQTP
jgi:AraC-like DNA-binding protein